MRLGLSRLLHAVSPAAAQLLLQPLDYWRLGSLRFADSLPQPLSLQFDLQYLFRTLSKGSRCQLYTVRNIGTFTKSVLSGTPANKID